MRDTAPLPLDLLSAVTPLPGQLLIERLDDSAVAVHIIIPDSAKRMSRSAKARIVKVGYGVWGYHPGETVLLGAGVGSEMEFVGDVHEAAAGPEHIKDGELNFRTLDKRTVRVTRTLEAIHPYMVMAKLPVIDTVKRDTHQPGTDRLPWDPEAAMVRDEGDARGPI